MAGPTYIFPNAILKILIHIIYTWTLGTKFFLKTLPIEYSIHKTLAFGVLSLSESQTQLWMIEMDIQNVQIFRNSTVKMVH